MILVFFAFLPGELQQVQRSQGSMQNTPPRTILIVDDDAGMRGLLEVLLESAGFQTLSAEDGKSALELLSANLGAIDGCLLDLNLEDCIGEELYDRLAAIDPSLAVFPMSGCYGEEIQERFGKRPISGIITKPFRSNQLFETIAAGLSDAAKDA